LDAFTRQTAEALALGADGCDYETLSRLMTGRPAAEPGLGEPLDAEVAAAVAEQLPRAVAALRDCGLAWGEEDRRRLVRTARHVLAPSASMPSSTGLGPSVAEATAGMSPARLQELLADAGLGATHDPQSAVAALAELFADRERFGGLLAQA